MLENWNYRVLKINYKNEVYFTFAEVYYDEIHNAVGWSECNEDLLKWDKYEDLKGTINLLSQAFSMSTLIVEGDKLIEIK